eukprot:12921999-Prorocentrum_lima.AAC.1
MHLYKEKSRGVSRREEEEEEEEEREGGLGHVPWQHFRQLPESGVETSTITFNASPNSCGRYYWWDTLCRD